VAKNEDRDQHTQNRTRAAFLETVGLIFLAVMLALILLLRWGGDITWSAR
jgi:hypothetical protein